MGEHFDIPAYVSANPVAHVCLTVPCRLCHPQATPMTPAVPDPTVEALSEAEREAIRVCPDCGHDEDFHSNVGCVKGYDRSPVEPCGCERQWSEVIPAAVERILAARAAAPDALRVRIEALAAEIEAIPVVLVRGATRYRERRSPSAMRAEAARMLRAVLKDGAQ